MKVIYPKLTIPGKQLNDVSIGNIIGFYKPDQNIYSIIKNIEENEIFIKVHNLDYTQLTPLHPKPEFSTLVRLGGKFEFIQRHLTSLTYLVPIESFLPKLSKDNIVIEETTKCFSTFEELEPGEIFYFVNVFPITLSSIEDKFMVVTNPIPNTDGIGYALNLNKNTILRFDKKAVVYPHKKIQLEVNIQIPEASK